MKDGMDALDRRLLNLMQQGLTVAQDPFAPAAQALGLEPDDVLSRLERLQRDGFIRRIGGVLNPSRCGYASSLYALEVPEPRYAETVRTVNSYPGVTHNYRRSGRLNLWFTLSVASEEEKVGILGAILRVSGAERVYDFPSERVFKLKVYLDLEEGSGSAPDCPRRPGLTEHRPGPVPDEADVRLLRQIHELPLCRDPFGEAARRAGLSRREAHSRLEALHASGALKRIGAVLRHRQAGFAANGMLVCWLPLDCLNEAGERLAGRAEVSHCYRRRAYSDWPYNLYAMIHGRSTGEVRHIAECFCREWQERLEDWDLLFSTAEWKKTSFSL
ncbi:siroheme decarboxylase subunit beta [Gorillibacterium sp. sgz500922]|uniref:siroheme decarboxylase subunit beta n=1 Tax=Gorillibacterium sp. sgz500922 TaxID=3446694 RepID=UPI003F664CF4